jgi:putative ABC transport system permease protein
MELPGPIGPAYTLMELRTIWHRATALFRRRRLERDLDDELAFHLAMREADYRRGGAGDDEARAAARRRFGNVASLKEQCRDMWTFHPLETLLQDVRYALRTLRKSPGFTFVAVLALAIGIGANTAIFSLIDAARARALPYPDSSQLVELWGNVLRATVERRGASYPDYLDWRARSRSFVDMAAFDSQWLTIYGLDEPERITTEFVSAPYFSVLGVAPVRGRTFQAEEDGIAKPAQVVVLSDGLWKRRFGADPAIVGRVITLCCAPRPYTVIGVMPPGFKGLTDRAELWVPFALWAGRDAMTSRGTRGFAALARLKAGVTKDAAQRELDGVSKQLEREYPDTNEKRAVEVSPLDAELFGELRPALLTLMAAVAFVLLIACANVANLLLARSEARRREMAVRTALGAGQARLLRQLVTEGCVLTLVGALFGIALARAAVDALLLESPVTFPSFVSPGVDLRVAAFTIVVSVACGILVGLVPGLQARGVDLSGSLKESTRGSDGRRSQRVRSGLVVAELSLAVVLLVGAGLMIRSVRNLAAINPGFDPDSVLVLHVSIPRAASPGAAAPGAPGTPAASPPPVVYGRALLERLRAVPGVAAAALGTDMPLDGGANASFYSAEGQAPSDVQNAPRAYVHRVSPEFFATLRIPILAGRTFTEAEATPSAAVAVVSDRIVGRFWPGQDPIGKRIKFGGLTSQSPWLSIVGVVGEVKYRGLPDNPTADPDVYVPFADRNSLLAFAVRGSVPPSSLVAPIRAAIRAADSSIPVYAVAPMRERIAIQTSRSRFTMWLMGVFAAVALALAVVGIYGVMSYLVTQRTREIGIRLALGAGGGDILRLVVGNGVRLIACGIAIGVAASFALQRLVSTLLFGVTAADSGSALAVAILGAVALAACYVPALRASRVSPLNALRYE